MYINSEINEYEWIKKKENKYFNISTKINSVHVFIQLYNKNNIIKIFIHIYYIYLCIICMCGKVYGWVWRAIEASNGL